MTQKNTKELCWGIIGGGEVCEVKSGPALMQISGSRVKSIMRRNLKKAKDFAERHGIPNAYNEADKLFQDPEINAIYIATPPDTHADYTVKAAAAGKLIYVEKPMARTFEECQIMIEACQQAKVPLFVAYYRRAFPNILKVKELLKANTIGSIRSVNISLQQRLETEIVSLTAENNWRVNPKIAGGGYFYDLASHQLDTLDFLLGPITEAKGYSENQSNTYEADDITLGSFKFANGAVGQGLWCFNISSVSQQDSITLLGSKGQISFPFFGDNHVLLETEAQGVQKFNFEISKHVHKPLIQTVVDEFQGKGSCPSTDISGARTNWVMEQFMGKTSNKKPSEEGFNT